VTVRIHNFTPFRIRKGEWLLPLSSLKQLKIENCQTFVNNSENYFSVQKQKRPAEKIPARRLGNHFQLNGMCAYVELHNCPIR